jgi:hypothetical protein
VPGPPRTNTSWPNPGPMPPTRATTAKITFITDENDDLSRPAKVFVPESDYDRAWQLFYAEREDEL